MDDLLSIARQRINLLEIGTEFVIKDLLADEWLKLVKGDKLYFGKVFKKAVERGEITSAKYDRKAENNSAVYRRK